MMRNVRRNLFVTGLFLIVVTNAVVLAGVVQNRSGQPESVLRFTERELRERTYPETEAVHLSLQWRVLPQDPRAYASARYGTPAWLDTPKLASLGFDVSPAKNRSEGRRRYGRSPPREVFLVLELDGIAYQESIKRAEQRANAEAERVLAAPFSAASRRPALEQLRRERNEASRLFAVDAGLDVTALRQRYPDRSRYAIVPGKIWIVEYSLSRDSATASIANAGDARISVPKEFRDVFERQIKRGFAPIEVEVAFGRQLEPWIVSASARTNVPAEE